MCVVAYGRNEWGVIGDKFKRKLSGLWLHSDSISAADFRIFNFLPRWIFMCVNIIGDESENITCATQVI